MASAYDLSCVLKFVLKFVKIFVLKIFFGCAQACIWLKCKFLHDLGDLIPHPCSDKHKIWHGEVPNVLFIASYRPCQYFAQNKCNSDAHSFRHNFGIDRQTDGIAKTISAICMHMLVLTRYNNPISQRLGERAFFYLCNMAAK